MDNALIVGFKDGTENGPMTPVTVDGRLAVFDTIRAARRAAGALGVGVPVSPARARELCREHGLKLPDVRAQLKQERLLL